MASDVLLSYQEEMIMHKGLIYGDFVLRSGERSDTKFEFDNIETDSAEFSLIVSSLTAMIDERIPRMEAIVSIPDGATRLGKAVAKELNLQHFQSFKTDDTSGFGIDVNFNDRDTRTVIIDDVYTQGTNLEKINKAAANEGLFIIGGVVILDRSVQKTPMMAFKGMRTKVQSIIKYSL